MEGLEVAHRRLRDRITAQPTLATELTAAARRAVQTAFARYADFVGVPVTVAWPVR